MNVRNILIVAATRLELEPLLAAYKMGEIPTGRITPLMLKQTPVDVLITGPGMVATAYYLGKVRGLQQYMMLLNAGIAGSFSPEINIGSVVNVGTDCFAEMGGFTANGFQPMYDMPMAAPYKQSGMSPENILQNSNAPVLNTVSALPSVKGITVNTMYGKHWKELPYTSDYNPEIETMEGAAFFFACQAAGVPCIQLRAISNTVGPQDMESWDIPAAVASLNAILMQLIDEL